MKTLRKIIEIDEARCDGCGRCVNACAEGALKLIGGKARVAADSFCDGLGACIGECPQGALKIVEREAEAFAEDTAVMHGKGQGEAVSHEVLPCGCPGSNVRTFSPPVAEGPAAAACDASGSALAHWPVKIRLVPADARFLKGADLLVAADCTAFAYAGFHSRLLQGKALMVGCPKLDDPKQIEEKLAEVFRTAGIKSVTIAAMEVPCCSRLAVIVRKAIGSSGRDIPVKEITVGIQGGLR